MNSKTYLITTPLICILTILGVFLLSPVKTMSDVRSSNSAVLGGGCFWCIEAVFQGFSGITKIESGYAGGKIPNPTYERVSTGSSGYAEVIHLEFDPKIISYQDILTIFFHAHDPTTKDRQGADVGTQYRSVIFYNSEEQKVDAQAVLKKIQSEQVWADPIVTEISPLQEFYRAEDYHQNYYNQNKAKPYCSLVIAPKLKKVYSEFKDKLTPELKAKVN